jgi:hypothetical protein
VTRKLATTALALALVAPLAPAALAQEKPAPPAQQTAAMVPLKLDIVISRTAGEKKISSMPYSLWVTANAPAGGALTRLRMGVTVPILATVFASKEGAESQPMRSYTNRDIGTNIDASASTAADGRYAVGITLNDSGLSAKVDGAVEGAPLLRNFTSHFYLLLRDGQTATYSSATDPVTGETLNVQVTLSVLK